MARRVSARFARPPSGRSTARVHAGRGERRIGRTRGGDRMRRGGPPAREQSAGDSLIGASLSVCGRPAGCLSAVRELLHEVSLRACGRLTGGAFPLACGRPAGRLRAVRELLHEVSSFSAGFAKIWTVWQSRPYRFACKSQTLFKPFKVSPVQIADERCKPEEHAAVDCQTGPFLTLDSLWADMRSHRTFRLL